GLAPGKPRRQLAAACARRGAGGRRRPDARHQRHLRRPPPPVPGTLMRRWVLALLLGALPASTLAQSFSAGGFLKLHALSGDLSESRELRGDQELFIPHLPPAATELRDDELNVHARASRLWLRASKLPTPLGEAEVLVEADLFK